MLKAMGCEDEAQDIREYGGRCKVYHFICVGCCPASRRLVASIISKSWFCVVVTGCSMYLLYAFERVLHLRRFCGLTIFLD